MLWRVHEPHSMTLLAQKLGPALHRRQDAAFAFLAQIHAQPALCGYQAHQAFRLVRVEVVGDEDPLGCWITGDALAHMGHKVFLRAAWSQCGCHYPPAGDLEISNQAERAMTNVLELAAFNVSWLHRQGWRGALQRLDAGHLIATQHMYALFAQALSLGIQLADRRDLLLKLGLVSAA